MEFQKLVGSGNDFVVVDNRGGTVSRRAALARKVCDRKFGVGADGLVLVEKSRTADLRMRIFNPDGSEAEMCGNGLRCTARFAADRRIVRSRRFTVEAKAGLYRAEVAGERVTVQMRLIGEPRTDVAVPLPSGALRGSFLDTGVPHFVMAVPDVSAVDVRETGRAIRFHKVFAPRGTNVDWVEIAGRRLLKLRTYERGVEDETLSCGTGTVAAVVAAFLAGAVDSPATVIAASGERLSVTFSKDLRDIFLAGRTRRPFAGTFGG